MRGLGSAGAYRRIRVLLLALLFPGIGLAGEQDVTLSAEAAYDQLRQTGELEGVTVTGRFDLGKLGPVALAPPSAGEYRIRDVAFSGPVELVGQGLGSSVRIERARFGAAVRLQQCALQGFTARESVWAGGLIVEGCEFRGVARFDGNDFQDDVRFHLSRFSRRPSFADSVFRGRTEFLECEFGTEDLPTRATSFSDVVFEGPALFNNSVFHTRAKFQSAVFGGDASFLNVTMDAGASFRNVHFKGDAEFRFCRISSADFGDRSNLTLFAKRADFRGCEMEQAVFDYAEFRGEVGFVNARFGADGASFRDANLGDDLTDFEGVSSEGPLVFSGAYLPALRFVWRDIRAAVLSAEPDARVLAALHARLEDLGDSDGALEVSYQLSRKRFEEEVALPLPSPTTAPSAFLDAASQSLIAYGEWWFWGWPTGYGTKLGRILLLTLACWLAAALPVARARRLIARIPADAPSEQGDKKDAPARIYEPVPVRDLGRPPCFPSSLRARLNLALRFTFRVLFKVGPRGARFVAAQPALASERRWRAYFAVLWYLGSLLLLLITLTLANTSPMIEKLIGALLP